MTRANTETWGNWLFYGFVGLVKWALTIGFCILALFLAKMGCDTLQERLQQAKQKKRKGKKKREEDIVTDDGMGLS